MNRISNRQRNSQSEKHNQLPTAIKHQLSRQKIRWTKKQAIEQTGENQASTTHQQINDSLRSILVSQCP
jgi:hypothetical protein